MFNITHAPNPNIAPKVVAVIEELTADAVAAALGVEVIDFELDDDFAGAADVFASNGYVYAVEPV